MENDKWWLNEYDIGSWADITCKPNGFHWQWEHGNCEWEYGYGNIFTFKAWQFNWATKRNRMVWRIRGERCRLELFAEFPRAMLIFNAEKSQAQPKQRKKWKKKLKLNALAGQEEDWGRWVQTGKKQGVGSRRQDAGSSPRTGAGCGRCWLKPAGLKLLLTSNQSKATYWLNKFNWQQQQWNERRAQRVWQGAGRSWEEVEGGE